MEEAKATGKTLVELNLGYFNDEFWKELIEYWNSEAHRHRSNVGSQNRQQLKTLHSAGAKGFDEWEEVQIFSL